MVLVGQDSLAHLQTALAACAQLQSFAPNLWLDAGGVPVTPFTDADLEGLAQAIASRPLPTYETLLLKIGEVMSASTVDEAQAIGW